MVPWHVGRPRAGTCVPAADDAHVQRILRNDLLACEQSSATGAAKPGRSTRSGDVSRSFFIMMSIDQGDTGSAHRRRGKEPEQVSANKLPDKDSNLEPS